MAIPVIVYGKSGSGKSRSLKNFASNEILFVNVERKRLPFKKSFDFSMSTYDVEKIKSALSSMGKKNIKTAVIDDVGYIMTSLFMQNHITMKGSSSFEMYNKIADTMYNLIHHVVHGVDNDAIVYFMFHEDTNDYGDTCLKTIGKLLDQKVCLEGMVTIALRCMSNDKKHFFRTITDGRDITKTPEEMFEQTEVDNDLKMVDDTIREYYCMPKFTPTED